MLETIVSWFVGVIGGALQWVLTQVYSHLELSLDTFYGSFKALATAYNILQACAIGLILAIAAWNLLKFFGGSLTKVQDTPIAILIRSMIATMLVFMGGYIVSMVVDVASVPYKAIMKIDPIRYGAEAMPNFADFTITDGTSAALGPGVALFISLIFIILIAWNLIKLVVEIVERYLMVGVLAYTAPIFYPFLCSSSTIEVFRKWVTMFIGQCALMSISVLFTTLVLTCFSPSGEEDVLIRLIFGLAMCKVAQRADTYMQQLGIGVATTGQDLLGDVLMLSRMFGQGGGFAGNGGSGGKGGPGGGSGGNSRASVLGTAATTGGIVGFGANMVKNFQDGMPLGKNIVESGKTAGMNSVPGMRYAQARKAAAAQRAVQTQQKFADRANYWNKAHNQGSSARGPVDKDYTKMAQEAGMTAQQYAKFQHGLNGSGSAVVNPPGDRKPGSGDQSGSFDLNKAAKSVGLSTGTIQYSGGRLLDGDESAHDADVIRGTDDMVADHIRENYNINNTGLMDRNGNVDETATEDYNAAMANTMRLGPSIVAEDVLFGADKTLEGNDELGAAAIEGAFGDNLRLDTAGGANGEGRLQDIKAETAPIQRTRDGQVISGGGRVVSGTYVAPVRDSNGNVMQKNGKDMTYQAELTIMDDVAYSQLNAQAQQQMEMVQSKSGGTYYVRRAEIQQNKVRNSSKRSEQREKASERFRRRGGRKSDRDD